MQHTSFVVAPSPSMLFQANAIQASAQLRPASDRVPGAQVLDLTGRGHRRCVTRQAPLANFHEVLGPLVVNALRYAFATA